MRLDADHLTWETAGRRILHAVTLDVRPGETLGIIGPNGSGKSTLLRCLAGLRTPSAGTVRYDGRDIARFTAKRLAHYVAFVEQDAQVASELRVADVVMLGRTPYRSPWRGSDERDQAIVAEELERMGLSHLRDRPWRGLSGGERQRAHIARGLAQRTGCLLLDEPVNHLDIRHQLELLGMLASSPTTVLISLHDLTLAARFCDRLALLDHGRLVALGPPGEVLAGDLVRAVFGVDARLETDHVGHPIVTLHTVTELEAPSAVVSTEQGDRA
ncbi:ABC transporter ATP-binding protein [Thermocrispum municipale]|uniref:ABC transporter ATP-binding protein n=1 Tax=Thermocrispum municipale TaxID=37926 RepID=UPI0003FA6AEF|nr:ABC transporter ATP-binding protein [Thermocrispum municipale]